MEPEVLEKSKVALAKAANHISELEKIISPTLVTFIVTDSITDLTAYAMHKFLRQLSDGQLSLLVESGGGNIDATAKITKMIRNRFKKFRAIVPYYAKSAATLLAVSADELYFCKSGELGPVDPQVRDPVTGMWIPAHSIKEAMSFIEESKDNLVKLSMAEKMPPLLMGAFRDAQKASREYLEEAFEKLKNKENAVNLFLNRYTSHGYPIDREVCKKEGLNVVFPDEKMESMICDLHETYFDYLNDLRKCESIKKQGEETAQFDVSIIQSADRKTLMINGEDVSDLV